MRNLGTDEICIRLTSHVVVVGEVPSARQQSRIFAPRHGLANAKLHLVIHYVVRHFTSPIHTILAPGGRPVTVAERPFASNFQAMHSTAKGRVQSQKFVVKPQILLCSMADQRHFPSGGIGRRARNILRQSPIMSE